jgi:glycolate oxidase
MSEQTAAEFLTLQEIVAAARANLAPGPWGYLIGAAETETTMRRNRLALDSIAFRPRVLRDVGALDSKATFLGREVRLPVLVAPVGGMELSVSRRSWRAAQRSSATDDALLRLPAWSKPPRRRRFAARVPALRAGRRRVADDWGGAREHGFRAFCFTVDTASRSRREREIVGRFVGAWRQNAQPARNTSRSWTR